MNIKAQKIRIPIQNEGHSLISMADLTKIERQSQLLLVSIRESCTLRTVSIEDEPTKEQWDALIDAGLVSDNSITWDDVELECKKRAVQFLNMTSAF